MVTELEQRSWANIVNTSAGCVKATTYDFFVRIDHKGIEREHHAYGHDEMRHISPLVKDKEVKAILDKIGARYTELLVFGIDAAIDLSDNADEWARQYPSADVITAHVICNYCEVTWLAMGFNNTADAMVFKLAEV